MNNSDNVRFKGGAFCNRYKIECQLTSLSPLHIGDGCMESDEKRLPKPDKKSNDESPKFTTVITDTNERAYIPGSSLKGNVRRWLEQVLTDFCVNGTDLQLACVNDTDRGKYLEDIVKENKKNMTQLVEKLRQTLKITERLFGSNTNEGKLEFWDADMADPPKIPEKRDGVAYSGYSEKRGTILLKSVAIDPKTGTAEKNKLYNYEVVPKGATFNVTITGQNLNDAELGMLFFVLDGFNSSIYPGMVKIRLRVKAFLIPFLFRFFDNRI